MRLRTSLTWGYGFCIGLFAMLATFPAFLGLASFARVAAPWPLTLGSSAIVACASAAVGVHAFTVLLTPRRVRLVGLRRAGGDGYPYEALIGTHRTGSGGEYYDAVGVVIEADGPLRGPLSRPLLTWESAAPARLVGARSPRAERSKSRLREIVAVVEAAHGPIRIERFDLADRQAILTMLGRSDE